MTNYPFKARVTPKELEALILSELRTHRGCEDSKAISIKRLAEAGPTNWIIGPCDFGSSDIATCVGVMSVFIPHFHERYALHDE